MTRELHRLAIGLLLVERVDDQPAIGRIDLAADAGIAAEDRLVAAGDEREGGR